MERETDLRRYVSELHEIADQLEGFIDEMKSIGLHRVSMDGLTKFARGIDLERRFLVKLDAAIAETRH